MSNQVTFGTLDDVALREAWDNEARGFTPWLAENLKRISEAIGVPLELEGTEVSVGRYAADILARNIADDSLVLIENQLEHGDHGHLGQILTYLTGLRAQTIVWVAADFREEHLSAINWLNQNTVDPFAFFAVKLRVVRIGSSPYAPLFEVVERPNGWDRRVQDLGRSASSASTASSIKQRIIERIKARHPDLDLQTGGPTSKWFELADLGLMVAVWIGEKSHGVFVRGPRGADKGAVAERLAPYANELEGALGAPMGKGVTYLFNKERRLDLTDQNHWDEAADWLASETRRYAEALANALGRGSDEVDRDA